MLKNRRMNTGAPARQCWFVRCLLALGALAAAVPAHAQHGGSLVDLINDYRADPDGCDGREADPAAPLAPHPALNRLPMAGPAHETEKPYAKTFRTPVTAYVGIVGQDVRASGRCWQRGSLKPAPVRKI